MPADFSSRFKKYSADNQLLLYLQGGPDLPAVRTYRSWLKEGRQVTKGQHGLKILAPRMVIKEDGTKAIDGLRLVTLFSVKQTELASQEA
ncbi:ArdC family protein [Lactobacillus delbrueckii]|uniref:ArdC family protein n=1 Tax=Lactobacillus delbrueckii TaxID=1584 RepID=UPI0022AF2F66|nr:ArdC family protein [Lactobacillus delbrueckii]